MTCPHPIDLGSLVEYWLGELERDATTIIDEHLLGCDVCGARMDEILALASSIRAEFERGSVHAYVTDDFVRGLKEQGLRVREYRLAHNGSVNCSVGSEDQVLVSRLEAPLEGVVRLDAIRETGDGKPRVFRDIPFNARSGVVVMSPSISAVRKLPAHQFRIRLVAVEGEAQRVIGEYTFNHSPG